MRPISRMKPGRATDVIQRPSLSLPCFRKNFVERFRPFSAELEAHSRRLASRCSSCKSSELLSWLQENGSNVKGLKFDIIEGMGFGAIATRDIEPSELVMSVPLEVQRLGSWTPVAITSEAVRSQTGPLGAVGRALNIIDVDHQLQGLVGGSAAAELQDAGGDATTRVPFDVAQISLLALGLLHEMARLEVSPWAPYLRVLPESVESPLLWNDAEIQQLQASPLVSRIRRRQQILRDTYDALFPRLCQLDAAAFPPAKCTWEAWQWAVITVSQRAFFIPDMHMMALCPGLDSVNHKSFTDRVNLKRPKESTCFSASARSKSAVLYFESGEGYNQGDQIFHEYADYTAGGTLLEYGFMPVDAYLSDLRGIPVAVPVDLRPLLGNGDPLNSMRLEVLALSGLCTNLLFELCSYGVCQGFEEMLVPEELWAAARVLCLESEKLKQFLGETRSEPLNVPDIWTIDGCGSDVERRMLQSLDVRIKDQLQAYTTNADHDQSQLIRYHEQGAHPSECLGLHWAMATLVRYGEKQALEGALRAIQSRA